jgi:hypothetical protein
MTVILCGSILSYLPYPNKQSGQMYLIRVREITQYASTHKIRPEEKKVCLRSPDRPYFSAADPNLFYRSLFDPNFC